MRSKQAAFKAQGRRHLQVKHRNHAVLGSHYCVQEEQVTTLKTGPNRSKYRSSLFAVMQVVFNKMFKHM